MMFYFVNLSYRLVHLYKINASKKQVVFRKIKNKTSIIK